MKKRAHWHWRGFGLRYNTGAWYAIHTPFGSVGIDGHRTVTPTWYSRGRCLEHELRIPLSKHWQLHLSTNGKDYLTLVDGPDELRNISWILDEFDHCFNKLAIASLRYHLHWSVCARPDPRYEDLIARLSERRPHMWDNDEEKTIIQAGHELDQLNNPTPEYQALIDRWWDRVQVYDARIDQARHDFVDIMRELWS